VHSERLVTKHAAGRVIRLARLLHMTHPAVRPDLLPPLFEPVLVKMTDRQMTLHGYQIGVEAGIVTHYSQYWVLQIVRQE
jgi:hypothetical protein